MSTTQPDDTHGRARGGASRGRVSLFARAPVLGTVKTRLAAELGDAAALAIYRRMLRRSVERVSRGDWHLSLHVAPDRSAARPDLWPKGADREPQGTGGLGDRMLRALRAATQASPVVVVGNDIPDLDACHVADAFAAPARAGIVFGPSGDGGFYLVGAAAPPPPGLFGGVPWSSPTTLAQAIGSCGARGACRAGRAPRRPRRCRDAAPPPERSGLGGIAGAGLNTERGERGRKQFRDRRTGAFRRLAPPAIEGLRPPLPETDPLESLYYVLCRACHRKCRHCYENRFRPYVKADLRRVVDEACAAFPRILANLPGRHDYLDLSEPDESAEGFARKPGRIILSGGDVLVDPVREAVLYPALEALAARYAGQGVRVVVQTTGDLVTPGIVDDLLARGVWMISISGMDDFHIGLEGEKRDPLRASLVGTFEAAGMTDSAVRADKRDWKVDDGLVYSFFGATDDASIGKIWPRGRAWENSLSRATIGDNFCNAWSGRLNSLSRGYSGSEVSIDPDGDVFPCCLKTKRPLCNLCEEPLDQILDSLAGHPACEAITTGHPERLGIAHGWDAARFLDACRTVKPNGEAYANLCIGCDRFHEAVLGPLLDDLRADRAARCVPARSA